MFHLSNRMDYLKLHEIHMSRFQRIFFFFFLVKSDLKEFFSMGQVAPKDPKSALLSPYMITLRHPDWKLSLKGRG